MGFDKSLKTVFKIHGFCWAGIWTGFCSLLEHAREWMLENWRQNFLAIWKNVLKKWILQNAFLQNKNVLKKNIGQSKIGYLSFYSNSKKAKHLNYHL